MNVARHLPIANPKRDPFKVLEAMAKVSWRVFQECYSPDCCIAATRVGIEALKPFGIAGRPLPVSAVLMNAAYLEGMRTGIYPEHARILLLDFEHTEGYPGHLVIVGKVKGMPFLLDLSAVQFDRPHKEIHVPHEGLFVELPKDFEFKDNWEIPLKLEGGGILVYSPHPYPERADFTKTPDWAFRTHRHREICEDKTRELVEATREELERAGA